MTNSVRICHIHLCRLLIAVCCLLLFSGVVLADERVAPIPAEYRSKNFLLTTDLNEEEAEALLTRLETMLRIVSRYWGAPSRKTIRLFVAEDLGRWPPGRLPPEGETAIRQGGITLARGMRYGRRFDFDAIVYSSAGGGTPQHEAVHAYCYQTFGETGPTWYAEGMAEMGNYWVENDPTVTCPDYIIEFLKRSPRPTIEEITVTDDVSGDGWRKYAWRWALCHFLANNANYAERFRVLGSNYLNGGTPSFERAFETTRPELEFEFNFFLDHLERGFDVGRCSWDWSARFRELKEKPVTAKVLADRGWQGGAIRVTQGQRIAYRATGEWQLLKEELEPGESICTADGLDDGSGKLVATIRTSTGLVTEFELGSKGVLEISEDGDLYLRCREPWSSIRDNSGSVNVEFQEAPTK
jgi:hypothetical protein